MKASVAREIAHAWVHEDGGRLPGFWAAHLSGSLARLPDEGVLPDFSDIDLYCVMEEGAEFPQQKLSYCGALLETVARPLSDYASAETVLSNPYLASTFTVDCVLTDPSGLLAPLHPVVKREYRQKRWLEARYAVVKEDVEGFYGWLDNPASLNEAVSKLGFTVRKLDALLAVAHLQVPTVRKSLANATHLLHSHGRDDLGDELLRVLGCHEWTKEQVRAGLKECAIVFDRASEVMQRPAVMEFNLIPAARPYLVEGTEEMIEEGQHREAVLWMMMVLWAANLCLQKDAPPEERPRWQERADRFYASLGLSSMEAYRQRVKEAYPLMERIVSYTDEAVMSYSEEPG
jgi:hypothetical protein